MTAKRGADRGVTREKRSINRSDGPKHSIPKGLSRNLKQMWKEQAKLEAVANFEKKLRSIEEERFGEFLDREVPNISFEEKSFGEEVARDQEQELCRFSVVSLALLDGENMLFACSGIALPHGTTRQELTRFVTSACLVREFNEKRNRDDKLRIRVRLPNNTTTDGFLGLYDNDIAIVTSIGHLRVCPVALDLQATPGHGQAPVVTSIDHLDAGAVDSDLQAGHLRAAGRAFESGYLMTMRGSVSKISPDIFLSDTQCFTEAAIGGPLVGNDKRFHGMILDLCSFDDGSRRHVEFLSQKFLRKRLELFQILNPKKRHFRGYSLPEGVSSILPSGFMRTIYRLRSYGYPMPPPLVLEFNGQLLNRFEERFGELHAWKGYPYPAPPNRTSEHVWTRLPKEVVTNISRCVVSLASFKGYVRSFACTGSLIKWHGSRATRAVVLTSASLVRKRYDEDVIDKNLRIEVFLPPNQRCDGTLEYYNLHYNIAIVSVKKGFSAIRPQDIFNEGMQMSSKEVVAIGRDTIHGLLMGTIGKVKHNKGGCKLKCKDLQSSTCKIKKAGIGGPLIDFINGSFVGMNFYDGSRVTPFLPRHMVVYVLRGVSNFKLPSERGDSPVAVNDVKRGGERNRWPVPKPYWFHGGIDVDRDYIPEPVGRTLQ